MAIELKQTKKSPTKAFATMVSFAQAVVNTANKNKHTLDWVYERVKEYRNAKSLDENKYNVHHWYTENQGKRLIVGLQYGHDGCMNVTIKHNE